MGKNTAQKIDFGKQDAAKKLEVPGMNNNDDDLEEITESQQVPFGQSSNQITYSMDDAGSDHPNV